MSQLLCNSVAIFIYGYHLPMVELFFFLIVILILLHGYSVQRLDLFNMIAKMSTCTNTVHASSKEKSLSRVRLFVTLQTVAYHVPPSVGFSRQEYWSGLPFPSSGDLPKPGIKPRSPALQADALPSELPGKPQHYQISLGGKFPIP